MDSLDSNHDGSSAIRIFAPAPEPGYAVMTMTTESRRDYEPVMTLPMTTPLESRAEPESEAPAAKPFVLKLYRPDTEDAPADEIVESNENDPEPVLLPIGIDHEANGTAEYSRQGVFPIPENMLKSTANKHRRLINSRFISVLSSDVEFDETHRQLHLHLAPFIDSTLLTADECATLDDIETSHLEDLDVLRFELLRYLQQNGFIEASEYVASAEPSNTLIHQDGSVHSPAIATDGTNVEHLRLVREPVADDFRSRAEPVAPTSYDGPESFPFRKPDTAV